MNHRLAGLALLASMAFGLAAMAANSTNGPPPEAKKEGGIVGDSSGAIRALGGTSDTDFEPGNNKVDVPKLGGSDEAGRINGAPAGTTRAR